MTAAPMLVVAAALIDCERRVLVAQRPAAKAHGGLWEFPGGKVEQGEALLPALARELAEELGISIDSAATTPVGFATRELADRELVLLLFAVDRWEGDPVATEHQALAWSSVEELARLPMPPADRALLSALQRHVASGWQRQEVEARAGIEPACKDLQSSA